MKFQHRLNQYDPEIPEISEMSDCIQLAIGRAEQIRDIGEIVLHFAEAEKSPNN